jgi:hypothetical protein
MMVEVPAAAIDLNNDRQVYIRATALLQYAIVARSVFGKLYDHMHVVETDGSRRQQLAVQIGGKDLDMYIEERAGVVDLLNDSKWSLQGQPLDIKSTSMH